MRRRSNQSPMRPLYRTRSVRSPGGRPRRTFHFTYGRWSSDHVPGMRLFPIRRPPFRVMPRSSRKNRRKWGMSPARPRLLPSMRTELKVPSPRGNRRTLAGYTFARPRIRASATWVGDASTDEADRLPFHPRPFARWREVTVDLRPAPIAVVPLELDGDLLPEPVVEHRAGV